MKTSLLLPFCFTIFSSYLFAQHGTISPSRFNILYIGVDNPIEVAAENVPCKDLKLEITPGSVIKGEENCTYYVRVTLVGKVQLTLKQVKKNGFEKIITQKEFGVRRIPDPVATFDLRLRGGIWRKDDFKYLKDIVAMQENFAFDYSYKVNSFRLVTCQNGDIVEETNSGPSLNSRTRSLMDSAKSGDVLFFDKISVLGEGESEAWRMLDPIVINVDSIFKRNCVSGKLSLPFNPSYFNSYTSFNTNVSDYKNEPSRTNLNCSCQCIDEAIGDYKDGRKTGWWIYNNSNESKKTLVRKEFYSGDTVLQLFYSDNKLIKERTYVGKYLSGDYFEYYETGTKKTEGRYLIDTVRAFPSYQINHITLKEEYVTLYEFEQAKTGNWKYYNESGKMILSEIYEKGKLIRKEDF